MSQQYKLSSKGQKLAELLDAWASDTWPTTEKEIRTLEDAGLTYNQTITQPGKVLAAAWFFHGKAAPASDTIRPFTMEQLNAEFRDYWGGSSSSRGRQSRVIDHRQGYSEVEELSRFLGTSLNAVEYDMEFLYRKYLIDKV